jgi:hypothetical protein
MAFVLVAEIGSDIARPLVGFGQQHAVLVPRVERAADLLEDGVGLGKILAARAVPLDEIGNGVEAQGIRVKIATREISGP